jgi:hypothetical protein
MDSLSRVGGEGPMMEHEFGLKSANASDDAPLFQMSRGRFISYLLLLLPALAILLMACGGGGSGGGTPPPQGT